MLWIFNKTEVKDDSLEVQTKEHAVKAFNKLLTQNNDFEEKIKPLIEERDKINFRRVELADYTRTCKVLSDVLDMKTIKNLSVVWEKYITEHKDLTEQQEKVQLKISTLSLEKKKVLEKAQNIFREHHLHQLEMEYPYF